jgi:murein DD-endopeptidase MepM/ murein hydrolase activator NlpD
MRVDRHRRRRAVLVPVGAALVLVVLAAVRHPRPGLVPAPRAAARAAESQPSAPPPPTRRPTRPLARWHDVRLVVPVADPMCVCYHEASYRNALPMRPFGRLMRDANPTKFPADTAPMHGPAYVIMSSRGRSTAATSAVDLVTRVGAPFRSPVDGVVVKVKPYRLYGRYPDTEVVIRPDADPRYRVVMIHLADVSVRPGERVVAGLTRLGIARVFSFTSETDYYVAGHHPHVHLEVVDPQRPR